MVPRPLKAIQTVVDGAANRGVPDHDPQPARRFQRRRRYLVEVADDSVIGNEGATRIEHRG